MARYVCELGYNTIAEADDLEELREQLDWQIDETNIDAVTCFDNVEQKPIDVYGLLGYDPLVNVYE